MFFVHILQILGPFVPRGLFLLLLFDAGRLVPLPLVFAVSGERFTAPILTEETTAKFREVVLGEVLPFDELPLKLAPMVRASNRVVPLHILRMFSPEMFSAFGFVPLPNTPVKPASVGQIRNPVGQKT